MYSRGTLRLSLFLQTKIPIKAEQEIKVAQAEGFTQEAFQEAVSKARRRNNGAAKEKYTAAVLRQTKAVVVNIIIISRGYLFRLLCYQKLPPA
jgi:hypothetical protein